MSYSIEKAFHDWVRDNPDGTATSALDQLHEICSDYYINIVSFDEVEYRGIQGGGKRAFGSGDMDVDLLYGSGRDDDMGTRMNFGFPFEFEFLLDQDGNIQKATKFIIDKSNFTGEDS